MRMRAATLRYWRHTHVIFFGLAACSGDNGGLVEPQPSLAATALTGSYMVTFEHFHPSALNEQESCKRIRLDMSGLSWQPVECENQLIAPGAPPSVMVRNDSVFLKISPFVGSRDIVLHQLTGTPGDAAALFSGMTCANMLNTGGLGQTDPTPTPVSFACANQALRHCATDLAV